MNMKSHRPSWRQREEQPPESVGSGLARAPGHALTPSGTELAPVWTGEGHWFAWVVSGMPGAFLPLQQGARAGGGPAGAGGKSLRRSSKKPSCVAGLFGSFPGMLPSLLIHLSPNSYRESAMSQARC